MVGLMVGVVRLIISDKRRACVIPRIEHARAGGGLCLSPFPTPLLLLATGVRSSALKPLSSPPPAPGLAHGGSGHGCSGEGGDVFIYSAIYLRQPCIDLKAYRRFYDPLVLCGGRAG